MNHDVSEGIVAEHENRFGHIEQSLHDQADRINRVERRLDGLYRLGWFTLAAALGADVNVHGNTLWVILSHLHL